jgi:D-3-phosphoglycerate dehydrogenase
MDTQGTNLLKERCNLIYAESPDDFFKKAGQANALIIVRSGTVSKETIEGAGGLKIIAKHGVGVDSIDLSAARRKGIQVTYTPDSNGISVAEHCISLFLMLAKKMHMGDLLIRKGKWKKDPFDFLGIELFGKTIGIMGFGRIGRLVARICSKGFDMNVLYYDIVRHPESEYDFKAVPVGIHDLFSKSDFISINLSLSPETRGIVNSALLKQMKNTAYLVNVGRGPLVKEDDLYEGLTKGWLAGAASDVFEKEPTREDNPLFSLENFIGTPHNAAHTEESMKRSSIMVAEDILAVLDGKPPKYPVPERMYPHA